MLLCSLRRDGIHHRRLGPLRRRDFGQPARQFNRRDPGRAHEPEPIAQIDAARQGDLLFRRDGLDHFRVFSAPRQRGDPDAESVLA